MTPPPCRCGETATGLVVEGHLHPYCAWEAERARAERYERAMGRAVAMLKHHRSASVRAAAVELSEALAADQEGRSS